MKVLNLQCRHQHSFEGWFGSEDEFQSQLERGLIECPLCADKKIFKLPSAPRLNLGVHAAVNALAVAVDGQAHASAASAAVPSDDSGRRADKQPSNLSTRTADGPNLATQAAFLKALRQVVNETEDVGERFASEARRMHYGDSEARSIRGQASLREAVELLEEGIEVMPLAMPPAIKETLQ